MDPKDMAKLGVANWDNVKVKTDWGEVVVCSVHSRDAPHEGTIFIPKGPGPM
nr:molybdopterin dinucleotide binding domain-containing protein [Methanobacterium formicicum]